MVYFLEERVLTLHSTLYLHILQCSETGASVPSCKHMRLQICIDLAEGQLQQLQGVVTCG